MAFRLPLFRKNTAWMLGLMLCALAGAAGCQTGYMTDEELPAAEFGGQISAPPVAVAPTAPYHPAVSAPVPQHPQPHSAVPAGWVPPSGVAVRPWHWIVIHHSATPTGGAMAFDKMHRAKGWDELGYDFVIGNGTDTTDGMIEVGSRWTKQKQGAHAKTADNRYNEYGIGICLVGNFDEQHPTAAQIQSLTRLTAYLMRTYHIAPQNVLGHRDTKPTDCPGRNINIAEIRRLATQLNLAQGYAVEPDKASTASTELMHDRAAR